MSSSAPLSKRPRSDGAPAPPPPAARRRLDAAGRAAPAPAPAPARPSSRPSSSSAAAAAAGGDDDDEDEDDEEEDEAALEEEEAELEREFIASGRARALAPGPAASVNNAPGLLAALASIRQDLPWVERLEVVSAEPAAISNVADDLQVELAFYGQALAAVVAARGELERLGVPHRRPADFFAEMLKTDAHMRRVKDKLLAEKAKITAVEGRRSAKEAAAFNKASAGEKMRAKAAEKKGALAAVADWRKAGKAGRAAGGAGAPRPELSTDKDLAALFKGARAGGGGGSGGGGGGGGAGERGGESAGEARAAARRAAHKRESKDAKFGHGGRKRALKTNDKASTSDMRGFSVKKMKATLPPGVRAGGRGGGAGGGAGGFGAAKKPGGFRGPKGAKGGSKRPGAGSKKGADRPGKRARAAGRK